MILAKCSFESVFLDSHFFRRGIVLTLANNEGKLAKAEISPMPGWNKETLEDAINQLENLRQKLLTTWWTKYTLHTLGNLDLYPSVHFGIESALLELLDPIEKRSEVRTYALLIGSPDELLHRAEEAYDEGHRFAKIKVGHLSPPTAHKIIEKTKDLFSLRLDFNRKWTKEDTIAFCKKYPNNQFEYLEEPTHNPNDLFTFPYPFALDETLREPNFTRFLHLENLQALIIKPTMLYPITPYLQLDKKIVITSSFEGQIGIEQIKQLIRRNHLESTLHGIDTFKYLSNHILEKTTP